MYEEGYTDGFYFIPGGEVEYFADDTEAWEYERSA